MHKVVEIVTTGPAGPIKQVVDLLLKERLIACFQIAKIESAYYWDERVQATNEVRIWMHTTKALATKAMGRVQELHPYQVPCIFYTNVENPLEEYVNWVQRETKNTF